VRGKDSFVVAVSEVIKDLKRGEVVSYGEVAARVGYPRAARAVGNVLVQRPINSLTMCHARGMLARVVCSGSDQAV
jgi:alkylated DNA nucleotide flippase Atl1